MNVAIDFIIQANELQFDKYSAIRYHTSVTFILNNILYMNGLIQQNEPSLMANDDKGMVLFYLGNATKSESKFSQTQLLF